MSVQRNLADLQNECQLLGLTVTQSGPRPAKDDYVLALHDYFMKRDYPSGKLPYVPIEPMLCFPEWDLKDSEQAFMWRSDKWVGQVKFNGCRAILHGVKGVGIFVHSRTISVQTYRHEELTQSLLFKDWIPEEDFSIDTEIIIEKPVDTKPYTRGKGEVTKSSLHSIAAVLHLDPDNARKLQVEQDAPAMFYCFDVMRWKGTDLRNETLAERDEIRLKGLAPYLKSTEIGKYFYFPEYVTGDKKTAFKKIVADGGEGMVLKHVDSTYLEDKRRRNGWVKAKKRIEFDAYVIGFTRGDEDKGFGQLVGNLEFAITTDKGEHLLGRPSNMTMAERQRISVYDAASNTVTMIPEMYGRVAQISGQDISAREFRLSHCTIGRWREATGPDAKRKEDCVTTMKALKNAAEWVS